MNRFVEGMVASAIIALATYLLCWFVILDPDPLHWSPWARLFWVGLTAWIYAKAMQRAE